MATISQLIFAAIEAGHDVEIVVTENLSAKKGVLTLPDGWVEDIEIYRIPSDLELEAADALSRLSEALEKVEAREKMCPCSCSKAAADIARSALRGE
jgi:hypothetical protein